MWHMNLGINCGMTEAETKEYERLLDKRQTRKGLSGEDYRRYLILVNKAFSENVYGLAKTWMKGFGL